MPRADESAEMENQLETTWASHGRGRQGLDSAELHLAMKKQLELIMPLVVQLCELIATQAGTINGKSGRFYILSLEQQQKTDSLVWGLGSMEDLDSWLLHIWQQHEEKQQHVGEAEAARSPGSLRDIPEHLEPPPHSRNHTGNTNLDVRTGPGHMSTENAGPGILRPVLWKLIRSRRVECQLLGQKRQVHHERLKEQGQLASCSHLASIRPVN